MRGKEGREKKTEGVIMSMRITRERGKREKETEGVIMGMHEDQQGKKERE